MSIKDKQRLEEFNKLGFEPYELAYLIKTYNLKKPKIKNIDLLPDKAKTKEPLGFSEFWSIYPKKVNKPRAITAFKNLKVNDELLKKMIVAIKQQIKSSAWQKENGAFIPHPATWLNGRRWEDECILDNNKTTNNNTEDIVLANVYTVPVFKKE